MIRLLIAASLSAALLSGCATAPATIVPASSESAVPTSSASTIVANAQAAFSSACKWLPLGQAAYSVVAGFLPASASGSVAAASAFLTRTCANPPSDVVTTIAAVEDAARTITAALSTPSAKSAKRRVALDDLTTVRAALVEGRAVVAQLAGVKAKQGRPHHAR